MHIQMPAKGLAETGRGGGGGGGEGGVGGGWLGGGGVGGVRGQYFIKTFPIYAFQ